MRRILLVAQREYMQNVRTKGFWIGIMFFPILLTLAIAAPMLLERTKSARRYAVIDRSGWLLQAVDRRIAAADLQEVLEEARRRHVEDPEGFALLPAPLREAVLPIAEAGPSAAAALAAAVVTGEPAAAGPDGAAAEAYASAGDGLAAWWRALPLGEAAAIASGVSAKRFLRVPVPPGDDPQAALNAMIRGERLFAYLVLGEEPIRGSAGFQYVSNNLTDEDLRDWFRGVASAEVRDRRLASEEIAPEVARWIQQPLDFEVLKVSASGEEEAIEERDMLRQWAPVAFVYLLWISVFSVSQMLMTNTVEEKSSRVIEVLLSSVSPMELLAGKIGGIATTGLTMVGSWLLMFFLVTKYLPPLMGAPPTLDLSALATDPVYILSFVAYFLLGYLFYAAILVGLGSLFSTVTEAQNVMPAIMMFLFVPLVTMVPIGRDPNGLLAQVLSWIPPFTPFVMMNRAAGPPTTLEYLGTSALLAVSIVAAMWAGAKVFRVGILLTGKPPKVREVLRWIRAPVGLVPVREERRP